MSDNISILVSGWRFIPHSYAVVNQFQCLQLLNRPGVKLYFRDLPYFRAKWSPAELFRPQQEAAIRSIPMLPDGVTPDVEYRIAFPYDLLLPSPAKRLFVYGTAEFHCVPDGYITGETPLAQAHEDARHAVIVTPSNWSRQGFIRSGGDGDRIVVIPNGFEPSLFHRPTGAQRAAARAQLGIAGDEFVFLSLGNMAGSKGMGLLLHTFVHLLRQGANVRLLLKGLDTIYSSTKFFDDTLGKFRNEDLALLSPRLTYVAQAFSFADMPRFYHAADCYVSPYYAEGFNIPVLEAAACGLPVICTAGGSTDDFTSDEFALRIKSTVTDTPGPQGPMAQMLVPDTQSLFDQMMRVMTDGAFRHHAAGAGPEFAHDQFTWPHVVDQLLAVLRSD